MRFSATLIALACALLGCSPVTTASAEQTIHGNWQLTQLDGQAFSASATLQFSPSGEVSGNAPCNRYWGKMTAILPAWETSAIAATKRACPDLRAEGAFFTALRAARSVSVDQGRLTLSDASGAALLIFTRDD